MTTKLPLWKILKGILHTEDENKHSHERIIESQEKSRQAIVEQQRINFMCVCAHTHTHTHICQKQHNCRDYTYLSILTLNVNGLNCPPSKDIDWQAGFKKEMTICFYKKPISQTETNIGLN
jgi:hypothetical protein